MSLVDNSIKLPADPLRWLLVDEIIYIGCQNGYVCVLEGTKEKSKPLAVIHTLKVNNWVSSFKKEGDAIFVGQWKGNLHMIKNNTVSLIKTF
jgi:hypothetical protein